MSPHRPALRIGCSGLPRGLHRERYFERLTYLECPDTAGPQAPRLKVLRSWRESSPDGHFGLIASQRITHPARGGLHDDLEPSQRSQAGGFRDTEVVRRALAVVSEQVSALGAEVVLFRSPPGLSRSAEGTLRTFFTELATPEHLGGARAVWEPGELWEIEAAVPFATELDVIVAVDPLAENPRGGAAPRPLDLLDPDRDAYLRVRGLGRAHHGLKDFELEELADRLGDFRSAWVVFAYGDGNRDAKKLSRLVAGGE